MTLSNKIFAVVLSACLLDFQATSQKVERDAVLAAVPASRQLDILHELGLLPRNHREYPTRLEQFFVLKSPDQPDLFVVPMAFVHVPLGMQGQCGVYFVPDTTTHYFVSAFDPDDAGEKCYSVKAAGLMSDPGPRPRIIVIFDSAAADGNDSWVSCLFTWEDTKNQYVLDTHYDDWLNKQNPIPSTIAGIRAAIARKLKQ